MNNNFQNINYLKSLYKNQNLIKFKGDFLNQYSNRKYSVRDIIVKFLLPAIRNKSVLDIGCGNCSFLGKLNRIYPKNSYYGLDIVNNNTCKKCVFINYKLYDGSLFPKYNQKFDIIFCMHTLYHVKNFEDFFRNVKELLKTEGFFIITTKSKFTFPKLEKMFWDIITKLHLSEKLGINKHRDESNFCLENALYILRKYFPDKFFKIEEYVLETQIVVDNQHDLLKYVFSTDRYNLVRKIQNKKVVRIYQNLWKENFRDIRFLIDRYVEVIYLIKRI